MGAAAQNAQSQQPRAAHFAGAGEPQVQQPAGGQQPAAARASHFAAPQPAVPVDVPAQPARPSHMRAANSQVEPAASRVNPYTAAAQAEKSGRVSRKEKKAARKAAKEAKKAQKAGIIPTGAPASGSAPATGYAPAGHYAPASGCAPATAAAPAGHYASAGTNAAAGASRSAGHYAPAATASAAAVPTAPHRTPSDQRKRSNRGSNRGSGRGRRIASTILIVIGIALLGVAGFIFVRAQLGYKQAADAYNDLAQYAVQDDSGDNIPNVDFDALNKISEDIVGWIYIPGTQINYPVAQGDDNTQYLRHLPDGTWNENGTIFMDMDDTSPGMVDQQTTLYGHHMNDGSMFKYVDNTLDQEDFDKVTSVYYITRDNIYKLKPLYTMQVEETYSEARQATFGETSDLQDYLRAGLKQAKAKADDASERIDSTEQVLTLVTCAGEIIPRTTRAAMVCTIEEVTPRTTE